MTSDQTQRYLAAAVAVADENVVLLEKLKYARRELRAIEAELAATRERCASAEAELAHFTNLFVASQRLHDTVEQREVLQAMEEIMINLVGTEEIAIFALDPRSGAAALSLLSSFGVARERLDRALDGGPIERAVETGETFVADDANREDEGLTACVPLRVQERVIGVIAVFRLLPQKRCIEALDRALFDLLATDGAKVLHFASRAQ